MVQRLGYPGLQTRAEYQERNQRFQDGHLHETRLRGSLQHAGVQHPKLGNVNEAFTYYEKALKLKPNFPEAREYYKVRPISRRATSQRPFSSTSSSKRREEGTRGSFSTRSRIS